MTLGFGVKDKEFPLTNSEIWESNFFNLRLFLTGNNRRSNSCVEWFKKIKYLLWYFHTENIQ